MSDFKWSSDDADSVILQHQPRTAVYRSQAGGVIVRQEGDMGEEDQLIYLTPQGALAIAWVMIEEAHAIGLPEPSLTLMVESPNWPPIIGKPNTDTPAPKPAPPGPLLAVMERGEAPIAQRGGK